MSIDLNLSTEDVQFRIKELLNKDNIKLWLEPYYKDNGGVGEEQIQAFQLLSEQFSQVLNISEDVCIVALRELQDQALDRVKCNEVFKETGVASLKVKVTGETPRVLIINIPLSAQTEELTAQVSTETSIPSDRLKIISHGRVLKPEKTLESQGIRNAMLLMAVTLADSTSLQEADDRFKSLERTKKDVQLLAGRSNANSEFYLQVENQSGEALNLPYHEQKALVTAMALHEKGRAALKKSDYAMALILFLESDKEYSECNSVLLNTCDNYALVQLDIAWCYLSLRSGSQIPDAARRLQICEQSFNRSYGSNLERLRAIKGATGSEAVLLMRLHLLQGVVLFHQNKRQEARLKLEQAQAELNGLKIDDNNVCLLMELGFTNTEARLGLRSTRGNIEAAEEFIQRRKRERELARDKNQRHIKSERERIKLGLCADGKQMVEPTKVAQLVAMGFEQRQAVEALRAANNVVSEAVTLIQEQPNLHAPVSEEIVAQVASLGFELDVAREALLKDPNLERVVKSLTSFLPNDPGTSAAVAAASASAMSFLEEVRQKRSARQEKEQQAFQRISEDLSDRDLTEDHLDSNLSDEEQFLTEYLSLLS